MQGSSMPCTQMFGERASACMHATARAVCPATRCTPASSFASHAHRCGYRPHCDSLLHNYVPAATSAFPAACGVSAGHALLLKDDVRWFSHSISPVPISVQLDSSVVMKLAPDAKVTSTTSGVYRLGCSLNAWMVGGEAEAEGVGSEKAV